MKSLVTHLTLRLALAVSTFAVTSACGTESQQSVLKSETLQPEYCFGAFSRGVSPSAITTYYVVCNGSTQKVWKNTYSFTFRGPSQKALDALVADVDSQLAQQGIKPVGHFPSKYPQVNHIDDYGHTVYSNRPKADFSFCLLGFNRLKGCSSSEKIRNKLEHNMPREQTGRADADWHGADAYLNSVGFELVFSRGSHVDYSTADLRLYVQ